MISRKWLSLTRTSYIIPEKYKVTHSENYPKARAHGSQSSSAWVSIHHKPVCALMFILRFLCVGQCAGSCGSRFRWLFIWFDLCLSSYYLFSMFPICSLFSFPPFMLFSGLFLCVYFTCFIGLSAIALCYFRHCLSVIAHYILIYYYLYMVIHNKSYI